MEIPLFQVDSFTREPFKGNPAAVCLLPEAREPGWMQNVAREMNLSETAFLYPEGKGFRLRWFTPRMEVDLCGHATLASAHLLWEEGRLKKTETALFETRSGLLSATLKDDWISMDFPAEAETAAATPPGLIEALGVTPKYVGLNRFDYLVEVESEAIVKNLAPDFYRMEEIDCRGIMVTARASSDEYDFVSRFFGPKAGIPEDPVTGSAHCCLGPFWGTLLHKKELVGYQASERGGIVRVELKGDRVILGGQAVTILQGSLKF